MCDSPLVRRTPVEREVAGVCYPTWRMTHPRHRASSRTPSLHRSPSDKRGVSVTRIFRLIKFVVKAGPV